MASTLTSACQGNLSGRGDIPSPASWQSHLRPAQLTAAYSPFVEETVYVPFYSHIYNEDQTKITLLAGTLSLRNTDRQTPIVLTSINYYSTDGKLLQKMISEPVILDPYATAEVVIPKAHTAGGSGANFIVEWMAEKKVNEPLFEAVMVNVGSSETISFVTRGVVTERREPAAAVKGGGRKPEGVRAPAGAKNPP